MKYRFLVVLSLMFLPALAGCGGSSAPSSGGASIHFTSPALSRAKAISAAYRCDDKKNWLPLTWGPVPSKTKELVLYMVRFGSPKVAKGGVVRAEIKAESIVVGLSPSLHSLPPGKFPNGARVGVHRVNGRGKVISICPPPGETGNILFRLYALPRKLGLSRSANLVKTMGEEALEAGTFIASYRSA